MAAARRMSWIILPSPPPLNTSDDFAPTRIRHPFYGFVHDWPGSALNAMPPRPRQADTVVVGLLGGSVAVGVQPYLQAALNRWFAANDPSRQPVVLNWHSWGGSQPQGTMVAVNTLLLGGEVDLIVNLDGLNELGNSLGAFGSGVFPFFPKHWNNQESLTGRELLLAGQLRILRREQARLTAAGETSPLRGSAVFGLANRWRQESNAAAIIRLNHQLMAIESKYNLEKHGPRIWLDSPGKMQPAAARFWYRSSLLLARLAELAGADYYHFLQPNQYVPDSKPLSPEERELAWSEGAPEKPLVEQGYPLLQEFSRDLENQGIDYFDLTGIFAAQPETLYKDTCCHLNARGNELLAAEMIRRMEPALLRRGKASPEESVSALAAARRPAPSPAGPTGRPAAPGFQLFVSEDGKELRYGRAGCAPGDTEPVFFLNIIPENVADLPPDRQEHGFAKRDFSFAEVGGRFERWQCTAQIRLPDYPIKEMQTGQYAPGQGDVWSVKLIAAPDYEQLRADYAALSVEQPVARDYFDLYVQDYRLIYSRESCAAADTTVDFFLHIIPENVADLPAEWRADGVAWSDFHFVRKGGIFDGKCLAAVPLPDYPIKEIHTGQHIPGQGHLWLAELITATAPDKLRAIYAALSNVEPVTRDYFDLYLLGHQLIYLRENCTVEDTAAPFFLPITPEDPADLPAERREVYFNHWGFNFAHGGFEFARQGGHFDGKCLAAVSLPDYPIAALRTGQHIAGQGDVWSVDLVAAPDPDKLRAEYAALSGVQPAARSDFDLYIQEGRLLYLRESCTDQDTAAGFFLYVFPEDLTDLPEEWRSDGNAYLGFNFVRWGGPFDGNCLAAVPLPDYPIKKVRTGQFVPGQGELWLVEFRAAP